MVLSFPVNLFTRVLPRGWAILAAFLILLAIILVIAFVFIPLLVEQIGALLRALPTLVQNLEQSLTDGLARLDQNGMLPRSPAEIAQNIGEEIERNIGILLQNMLGGTWGFVYGTFNAALFLFALIFVAASLLANVRDFKAAFLNSVPHRYRWDSRQLWNALGHVLTRYIAGLMFILAIQGALSALALYFIGVPYALALGTWVSITAVVPFIGAWIGAVPAIVVALSVSPSAVFLTALTFLIIQQLEGNFLTPRIQGQTLNVPSVLIFLAVIAGGALGGISGVLVAVPAVAVLRVLFDFFRVRLKIR